MEIYQEPVLKVCQCCSLLVWFIIACVGTRAKNLDYGVVYIPSNTFVEFWNYPPSPFPLPHHKFYVGLLRIFRFVYLKRSTTASPDKSCGVLPAISPPASTVSAILGRSFISLEEQLSVQNRALIESYHCTASLIQSLYLESLSSSHSSY